MADSTKKLGKRQRLFLKVLRNLEQEQGVGEHFHVWTILDRAFEISDELQRIEEARNRRAVQERDTRAQALAAGGSIERELDRVDRLLEADLVRRAARRQPRTSPAWVDRYLGAARTLRVLEKRGLISRMGARRTSSAALTEAGRSA